MQQITSLPNLQTLFCFVSSAPAFVNTVENILHKKEGQISIDWSGRSCMS
jgi:hypothetical protein